MPQSFLLKTEKGQAAISVNAVDGLSYILMNTTIVLGT